MQLVRLGDTKGLNMDWLLGWEAVRPPEPAPAPEPEPEPIPVPLPELGPDDPSATPAATVAAKPETEPTLTLTLHLAAGSATQDIRLEGPEAEAMLAYLHSRSGALVRPK